ncbi:hypothetical protein ABW20_dc0106358 [Dactylellina cionopaga]|nr:hypothetical protein ABW20_dc0106358 [Dactylellina cionopaga]
MIKCLDLYAFLVNYKYPRPLVAQRTEYYRYALSAVFEAILGLPASTIQFHQDSTFAAQPQFMFDAYDLLSLTSAGIYAYGDEYFPKIGYTKKYARMMNELLPGLKGPKMSASDPGSKIDLIDPPEVIHKKIMEAVCEPGTTRDNPILALLRIVIMPISKLRLVTSARKEAGVSIYPPFTAADAPDGAIYSIKADSGQHRHYMSYEEIENAFLSEDISPSSLKNSVSGTLSQLLAPIRKTFDSNAQWQEVLKLAYPESEE